MADALWGSDGTQPLAPQPAWADPLSGLVTGAVYDPEPVTVHVDKPPMPDMTEVRKVVEAVLADDEEVAPPPRPKSVRPAQFAAPLESLTPGMVAPNPRPGWPRSPSVRQRPGLRPAALRAARGPQVTKGGIGRAQGFSAGIGGVIVVVVVVIVIVVIIINSLINEISGILK